MALLAAALAAVVLRTEPNHAGLTGFTMPAAPSVAAATGSASVADPQATTGAHAVFTQFTDWMARYQANPTDDELANEGVRLATVRAAAMKALIQSDPKAALGLAIDAPRQSELPQAVRDRLEQRLSGQGRMNVDGVIPMAGAAMPERGVLRGLVVENGGAIHEYSAYVYGRRARELTAASTRFEGVVLENQLAVFDHGDDPEHGAHCEACQQQAGYGRGAKAWGDASLGSSDVTARPALSWTTGVKKVLIIRVDFSDAPGEPAAVPGGPPLTSTLAADEFNKAGGINEFYVKTSYAKTSLVTDVSPTLYRMPNTAAYYAQGDGVQSYSGALRDAARLAASADYDLSGYDRIGVVCTNLSALPNSKVGFAGVANIYGENFLISGEYDFKVLAHEIGHTYGVSHANWWKPSNGTTLGTEADMLTSFTNGAMQFISMEYMDRYDIMGASNVTPVDTGFEFNHWFKNLLGWIPDTSVRTVTSSGTYRVYRFDDPAVDLTNHPMALKIGRDVRRDYWVGFRHQAFANSNLASGAYLLFGYNFNSASDLLACNNPGVNVDSAGLQVGQSLVDAAAGVTITTVAQGGTAPHEYLDIAVTMQPRVAFTRPLYAVETTTGTASVTVERQGGSSGASTVNYSCVDGTALSGTHYTGGSGTLTWADGDTTPRTLTFPVILPYAASQGARDFTVQLTGATNGVVINPGTATVSLRPPGNPDPAYYADQMGGGIYSLALQPDGKLLASGFFNQAGYGGGVNFRSGGIVRLNADGTRDYTFDTRVGVTGNTANPNVRAIRVQPDGKVLVGGDFSNINNASPARPVLARLNGDGSLDPDFHPPAIGGNVEGIAIQPDGKIVVVGDFRTVNGSPSKGLCRLWPDGTLDFAYDAPGNFMDMALLGVELDHFSNAGPDAGVRIFATGTLYTFYDPLGYQAGLLCLRPDGTRDPGFVIGAGAQVAAGTTGWPNISYTKSIALQNDGKVLVGGMFNAFNNSVKSHLVRLNPDGSVDETFNPPVFGVASGYVEVTSLLVQPDGRIVVGGTFTTVGGVTENHLIRLTASGAIDPEWDNGTGSANGTGNQSVRAMLLRQDGRLLVSTGNYTSIRGVAVAPIPDVAYQGVTTQTLYSGLPGLSGGGQFRVASHGVLPGNVLQIAVRRVNGSAGAVKLDYSTQDETAQAGGDYLAAAGTLAWAAGDTTAKTLTIQCLPGAVTGRTFRLNLGIPSAGLTLASIPSTRITISAANSYDAWRSQNFDGPQQCDDAISGPTASLTGDGTPNLMKYALGLAPAAGFDPSVRPQGTTAGGRLRFAFRRDPLKTDLTYEVQGSSDLQTWTAVARSNSGSPTANLGAYSVLETTAGDHVDVTVEDVAPTSQASRFLRLHVSQ